MKTRYLFSLLLLLSTVPAWSKVIQKDFNCLSPNNDSMVVMSGDRQQTVSFRWESAKADPLTVCQYNVYLDFHNGTFVPLLSSMAADSFGYKNELNVTYGDFYSAITYFAPNFDLGDTIHIDWMVWSTGNIGSDVDNRGSLNKKSMYVVKGQFLDELMPFKLKKPNLSFGPIDVYQSSSVKVDFEWDMATCPNGCTGTTYTIMIDSLTSDFESDPTYFYSENFLTDSAAAITMGNIVAFLKQMNVGYNDTLTVKWRVTAYNFDADPVSRNCARDEYVTFRRTWPEGIDEISGLTILQTGANPTSQDFALRISLAKPQQLKLCLLDMQGKLVWESSQNQGLQGSNDLSFPTQNLSSGIYIYKVQGTEGSISGKVVVANE